MKTNNSTPVWDCPRSPQPRPTLARAFTTRTFLLCLVAPGIQLGYGQPLPATEGPLVGNLGQQSVQSYPRAFFNRFNPQTAEDLIDRLPGFTLDAGDDELRGFGGAAGNVLIDGERPSSKVGGIEDALRRTPADQVDRIEVIRGSAGLGEAAGQAVVANIIRRRDRRAGSWEGYLERPADGIFYPSAEVTLAQRIGTWDTATKLNSFWERYPLKGTRLQRDADSELTSSQFEDRPSALGQLYLSSEAKSFLAEGTLTLTGRAGRSEFRPYTERLGYDGRLPDDRPDSRFRITYDSILTEGELGIDWNRAFDAGWNLKILSLTALQGLDDDQQVRTEQPVGDVVSGSSFRLAEDSLETVLRTVLTKATDGPLIPEFGGEITFNRLDSALALETFVGDQTSVIELPAANVTVEELRGELFLNAIWRTSTQFSLETGLAAEASEIQVSGDASNRQSFFFLKPFATAIYDWRPGLQLRAGVRRTVGQLEFSEFAASASAEDDRFLGGNPELGPDQTTRASVTVDLRSDARGALNLEAFHEWRYDVIEQIALPSGAFGAANAGDGRVWGLTANASLPLAPFLKGGLIEVEADVRDSVFRDPLTGQERELSDVRSPTVLVEFRQDLPRHRFSWGVSYRAARDNAVFFADEESFTTDEDSYRVFVETTRFWGIRTNLELRNLEGRSFYRQRRFFRPDRSAEFVGSETIDRERGMFARLTFTGQF
ncbi:MAG: TonB-dependent receptor [Pseudomonadota bacterium]